MKNKLVIFLSAIILGVSAIFVPLFNKGADKAHAITSSDTTSYVTVNELWDSANQKVNKDNLLTLFDYVSGTLNTQYNTIEQLAEGKLTSKDMRANALSSYNGTAIKEEGKDIVVTLGGLKWQVVYLSENKNGEPILTLWSANSLTGGQFSTYSKNQSAVDPVNILYPSNMYGTSNMRSVVLNNGGLRATSETSLVEVEKNTASIFAPFTISVDGEYNDITDFITTPELVSWQEFQSKKEYDVRCHSNEAHNLSNESWSKEMLDTDFYSSSHNYAHKEYSDAWKTDFIWLPSLTEVGGAKAEKGVWELSLKQKAADSDYDLRTTDNYRFSVDGILQIKASGAQVYDPWTTQSFPVRPALHLNLSAMIDSLEETTSPANVYLDPVYGDDNNSGLTEYMAVKTLDVATSKVEDKGTINVMNTIKIVDDCVLGFSKQYTLKRYYNNETRNYQGTMLEIGVYDASIPANNKRPNVVIDNVVIDGNSTKAASFDARDGVIDVINGNLSFEDGSGLKNHNGSNTDIEHVGYAIELYNNSNITINGGTFDKNYNFNYATIVRNRGDGKVVINGGTFTKNHTNHWGLFYSDYIEINGGTFGGWVDTNEDGIYQTTEGLGNSAHNDAIIGFGSGTIIINDGNFLYNFAPDGGGGPKQALFSSSKMIVNGGYFANNYDEETRRTERGGAVFNVLGSLEINGGLFENNKTKKTGGVISLNN